MANPRKVNENGKVFIELNAENDVIELKENPDSIYVSSVMFKLKELLISIGCRLLYLSSSNWNDSYYKKRSKWLNEGIKCELLELGSPTWKPGKLKVSWRLEFYPDEPENSEPESPLDDIRQMIKNGEINGD